MRFVSLAALFFFVVAIAGAGCGPPRINLPTGVGTPEPGYGPIFDAATASCRGVRTLTADLALSGSAGRQKVRGHLLAGFAPGALRIEGVAPFGGPMFILVADNGRGTLLLPRDRRVLESASPADILDALVGVPLSPDDLLAALTGCVKAGAMPAGARRFGPDWLVADLTGGGAVYLNRGKAGWRIVAGSSAGFEIEYGTPLGGLPRAVRFRSAPVRAGAPVDLEVKLQSFEMNAAIGREAFSVVVPPGTSPVTLDELRRSGPLGP